MYRERCPYVVSTSGYCKEIDDYIEGADRCTLVDKWCVLVSGDTCETYEEFLNELLADEAAMIEQAKSDSIQELYSKEEYNETRAL